MSKAGKMNERMCIVTRETRTTDQLIRFVLSPSDELIPDLKQKLPGRGCWVLANKLFIEEAQKKKMFSRAFKLRVDTPQNLACYVDKLMVKSTFGMINIARKAGQFVTGHTKVDQAIRKGEAIASFHTTDAAIDGVRKIDQARTFFSKMTETEIIPSFQLFSSQEMSDAIGGGNYIHASALVGKAGESVLKQAKMLVKYRKLPN